MDVIRHIILGLVFVTLGFAAFAVNMGFDPLWRMGSIMAVGTVAIVGAAIFLWSALKPRG